MNISADPFIVMFSILIICFYVIHFIKKASSTQDPSLLQQFLQFLAVITILIRSLYEYILLKGLYANEIKDIFIKKSSEHNLLQYISENISMSLSILSLSLIFKIIKPVDNLLNNNGFYKTAAVYSYTSLRLIPILLILKNLKLSDSSLFPSILMEIFLSAESLLLLNIHLHMIRKILKSKKQMETIYISERFNVENNLQVLKKIEIGFSITFALESMFRIGFLFVSISDKSEILMILKDFCSVLKLGHLAIQFFTIIELLFMETRSNEVHLKMKENKKKMKFFNFNLESERSENITSEVFIEAIE